MKAESARLIFTRHSASEPHKWTCAFESSQDFLGGGETEIEAEISLMTSLLKSGCAEDIDYILSRLYKLNPSIDNYLYLRNNYSNFDIEIAIHGGFDHAFTMKPEISDAGIDTDEFLGLLDADQNSISSVCLKLLKQVSIRDNLRNSGETHLSGRKIVVPDHFINWIIFVILDAQSWNDTLELNKDLIVLIKSMLMPGVSQLEDQHETREQKTRSTFIGGKLLAMGLTPSYRKVAFLMDVQPSTVKRWFPSHPDFVSECEKWARGFDKHGHLKPLVPKEALRKE